MRRVCTTRPGAPARPSLTQRVMKRSIQLWPLFKGGAAYVALVEDSPNSWACLRGVNGYKPVVRRTSSSHSTPNESTQTWSKDRKTDTPWRWGRLALGPRAAADSRRCTVVALKATAAIAPKSPIQGVRSPSAAESARTMKYPAGTPIVVGSGQNAPGFPSSASPGGEQLASAAGGAFGEREVVLCGAFHEGASRRFLPLHP